MGADDDPIRAKLAALPDAIGVIASLFAYAPVGLQVYKASGECLLVNDAFRRIFGAEPPPDYNVLRDDVAARRGVLHFIHRAFRGEVIDVPPVWYDPRELRQLEVTEGRRVAVAATMVPLFDRGGAVSHVAILFRDISAEAERRELLEAIIEQSGQGIIVADEHGALLVFNPEAERQYGRPRHEIGEEDWAPLVRRALAGERVDEATWVVVRPDGSRRTLIGSARPLRRTDGSSAGAVLLTRDATERVEMGEQLRRLAEERERFFALIENSPDFIAIADPEGKPVYVNPAGRRLVGLPDAEPVTATRVRDYFPPDQRRFVREVIIPAMVRDGRWAGETWLRHWQTGARIPVSDTHFIIREPGSARVLGSGSILRDISAQRLAHGEREELLAREHRARADAEAANRAKDQFLALLGHELRNPLSPIVTALELIRLKGSAGGERELDVIRRQVAHLVRLVDDLLDVSRIARGNISLRTESVRVADVAAKAVEIASPLLEERRHHFSSAVPGDLWVDADPVRLAQVFANLLTNAAKYTEPGGRIALTAEGVGETVVVRVADTGIGIPEALLGQVFGLFVQAPQPERRAPGGLGLGLALVKSLVELHGGTVAAASPGPGLGSTFTVTLPALPAERAQPVAPPVPAAKLTAGRRVLVVDDNRDAAELIAAVLRAAGHEVAVAHDAPQALRVARALEPEVALLDIGLPVMDGYELAARLRVELKAPPRLVAVTGYGQNHDVARSGAAGFAAHLVKPVEAARLLAVVAG